MSAECLQDLLRAYSALCPPRTLKFPSDLPFTTVHDFVLDNMLLSRHLEQYSPTQSYQLQFWKWVISNLEAMIGDEASLFLLFPLLRGHLAIVKCHDLIWASSCLG